MLSYYQPTVLEHDVYLPQWWCEGLTMTDTEEMIAFGNASASQMTWTRMHDPTLGFYYHVHCSDTIDTQDLYQSWRCQRRHYYFACHWYPHLMNHGIPTIESQLCLSSKWDIRHDLSHLWNQTSSYGKSRFVRLCGGSPKDILFPCLFTHPGSATDALMSSTRTRSLMEEYPVHLMVRRAITLHQECRCFIHQGQLNAVSVYEPMPEADRPRLESQVLAFMTMHGDQLPYQSCVMELIWTSDNDSPCVVEFNSFGSDMYAGGSLFDWDNDVELLYGQVIPHEVVFRYVDSESKIREDDVER